MVFIDLVSAISHVLPQLVAASARRTEDEMIFGSKIGYAFVSPTGSDTSEPIAIESVNTWSRLEGDTFGVLGNSRIGQAVARTTYKRFGADVVCHHSATSADTESDDFGRRAVL